jgi:hypothetical protein
MKGKVINKRTKKIKHLMWMKSEKLKCEFFISPLKIRKGFSIYDRLIFV